MAAENSAVRPATFASLGVPGPLVAVLDDDGITTPFPIQQATLPDALAGRDILGRAKTGSGKTLGFALPLVARLAAGRTAAGRPRGLVLVPTRELATQVYGVLKPLAKASGLWVATIYGGVSQGPQVNALRRRTDIVVATPGRLADLIGQGHCDLGDVEITVIDEADQMADLGFLPVVRRLLEATPADGQRLLFSATLDSAIDVLARRFLTDPAHHAVDDNSSPAEIEHHVITVDPADRVEVIAALAGGDKRSLVFTRTKHGAERLARQLTTAGIPAAELHGNLRQGARSRNLAAFGSGAVRVMVATDIAARGIHVDGVDLVIHADPPAEHKAYVHRSGRTARGGADGVVVTMQTAAQARDVRDLMRKAGVTPQVAEADPESTVLREIAGPPAPRVALLKPEAGLVRPEDRFSDRPGAGQPGAGRPGSGKPRQRKPRAYGDGRPARPFGDAQRPGEDERFDRAERPGGERADRPARRFEDKSRYGQRDQAEQLSGDRATDGRPEPSARRFDRDEESGRSEGSGRPERFEEPQRFDRPERPARAERTQEAESDRAAADRGGWTDGRGGRDGRGRGGWTPVRPARGERTWDGARDRADDERRGGTDRGGERDGRTPGNGRGEWTPGRPARGEQQRTWDGERRGAGNGRGGWAPGRPARGEKRAWDGGRDRAADDRRGWSDGRDGRGRDEWAPGRPAREDRTWHAGRERATGDRRGWSDGRGGRDERGRGEWTPGRPARQERGEWAPGRPGGGDRGQWPNAGRPGRGERGEPAERGAGGRAWRADRTGAERGGRRGGAAVRSGYAGNRAADGQRRKPGQGRHS